MNKKKIILSSALALVVLWVCWAAYPLLNYSDETIVAERPSGERSFGEYEVRPAGNINQFCGKDEVLDKNGTSIVILNLCEDNIHTIKTQGDWIVIITDAGRSYKKNLATGQEILNTWGGIGSLGVQK